MANQLKSSVKVAVGVLLATMMTACGNMTIPLSMTMDPSKANTLSIVLPSALGGGTVSSNLVGNTVGSVTLNTNKLLNPGGVPGTVAITSFNVAGTAINLGSIPSGTLCTFVPPGATAGGTVTLDPLLTRTGTFKLTIPTETISVDPNIRLLIPPINLQIDINAKAPVTINSLLSLLTAGTGISLHQVSNLTIPSDIPILGGQPITFDATLMASKNLSKDSKLADCAAAIASL
jgi:hypothetical protein